MGEQAQGTVKGTPGAEGWNRMCGQRCAVLRGLLHREEPAKVLQHTKHIPHQFQASPLEEQCEN